MLKNPLVQLFQKSQRIELVGSGHGCAFGGAELSLLDHVHGLQGTRAGVAFLPEVTH